MTAAYRAKVASCYNWRPLAGIENEPIEALEPPSFNGVGNIEEFFTELEDFFEIRKIPETAKCVFLRRLLKGQALQWFKAFGKDITPEEGISKYTSLAKALKTAYPARRNTAELEAEFFASWQGYSQSPVDFTLKMVNIHTELELKYEDEKLITHVLNRLKPAVRDFVEVRNATTPRKLFELVKLYEERHAYRSERRFPPQQNYAGRVQQQQRLETPRYGDNNRYRGYQNAPRQQQYRAPQKRQEFQQQRRNQGYQRVQVSAISIHAQHLPHINIIANGIYCTALLDTGSGASVVSERFYLRYLRFLKCKNVEIQARDAQDKIIPTRGEIQIKIEIRQHCCHWRFLVLRNIPHDIIIGEDFMRKYQLKIDFAEQQLLIQNEKRGEPKIKPQPIVVEWKETCLTEVQKDKLVKMMESFDCLFSDQPGTTDSCYHEIKTRDAKPVASRPYRYDKVKQGIVDYHIKKMLDEGIIMPIESPYASPIVLCRKNNGKPKEDPEAWRFAIDYRKLNEITECPQYPIPNIDELIASLPTTNFMTSLDLTAGYHQVPVHPKSIEKTAFISTKGVFGFKKMPFGLSGAPATFQRLMDTILKNMLGKNVFVYLDDILIVSESFSEHLMHLKQVFHAIQRAGMTIKLSKCAFARKELKYLGYKITPEGVKADTTKIEAVKDMPPPKNAKQLASFLGLVGWYQKFIPGYAKICEPLYALKRKRVKFIWSSEAQNAFEELKRILISDRIVLATPNYCKPLEVWTDASSVGIGAVLAQEGRPIAFASRSLKQAERNYAIFEREALAVIFGLEKFRPYFNELPVKVITDHSALTKITHGKNLSPRMIRWSLRLAEFNTEIEHRAGKENVVADGLSRIPMKEEEKEGVVSCCMITSTVIENIEKFKHEQRNDAELGIIYKYLEDPDAVSLGNAALCVQRSQDFRLIDGLLFYARKVNSRNELRVFIPQTLRKAILREHHDNPLAGHLGIKKTFSRLHEVCYFPQMRKFVTKYVSSCDTCQRYNYKNILPAGKLLSINVKNPLDIVGVDLIGPYPLSNPERHRYVLVIVDYFSKWVEFVPLRKASAQAVTKAFVENFICRYGTPLQVVSDNGPQFLSQIFRQMCEQLDIKHVKTVPYRPQSNQAERVNRNLVQMISAYVGNCHSNWDRYLTHFAYALRTAVHETTGKSPAELFLGRKILTPFQRLITTAHEQERGMAKKLEEVIKEARKHIERAQKKQAAYYNLRRREMDIKIGDFILLQNHQLSSAPNRVVGKFFPKYIGPFKVLSVHNNNIKIDKDGQNMMVNLDQVRVYKFRTDSALSICSSPTGSRGTSSRSTAGRTTGRDESTVTSPETDAPPQSQSPQQRRTRHEKHQKPDVPKVRKRAPPTTTTGSRPPAKRQQPNIKTGDKRSPPTISTDRRQAVKKQPRYPRREERRPPPTVSTDRVPQHKKQAPPRKDRKCPGDKRIQTESSLSGRPQEKRRQWQDPQHPYPTRSKGQQRYPQPQRRHPKVSQDAERDMLEWCWRRKAETRLTASLARTFSSSTL